MLAIPADGRESTYFDDFATGHIEERWFAPHVAYSVSAPALLMQMSMPPNWATVAETVASIWSSCLISQKSGRACPPAFSIFRAAVLIVPGKEG
jgi:hypothetical protein